MITNENTYTIYAHHAAEIKEDERERNKFNKLGDLRKNNRKRTKGRRIQCIAVQSNPGQWPPKFKEIFIKHMAR